MATKDKAPHAGRMKIDYTSLLKESKRHRNMLAAYDHCIRVLEAGRETEAQLDKLQPEIDRKTKENAELEKTNEALRQENDRLVREKTAQAERNGRDLAAFKADFKQREDFKKKEFDKFVEMIEHKKAELQKEFDEKKKVLDEELHIAERAVRIAKGEVANLAAKLIGQPPAEAGQEVIASSDDGGHD